MTTAQAHLSFDKPAFYLNKREFDIQIRAETIQEFTKAKVFSRILDIGCGNGAVSLPLLTKNRHLTLLDIAANMLTVAATNVPPAMADRVELVHGSFTTANLKPNSYDLVICLGVLAHVESPAEVIAKIRRVLRPGGTLILEFTDSYHPWGRVTVLNNALMSYLKSEPHSFNLLSRSKVVELCKQEGFAPSALFRYGAPAPGMHRAFNQRTLYWITRKLFGTAARSRNCWLGNEYIYEFES